MEKRLIIVAYADLIGYTKWSRQPLIPSEAREIFIEKYYDEISHFVLTTDFKVKYLGDGFMVIHELKALGTRIYDVLRFLFEIHKLMRRIKGLLKETDFAPEGIRVRAVIGTAAIKQMPDPNCKEKMASEYFSPAIDLAQRLLKIKPHIFFICHKSVVNIVRLRFVNVHLRSIFKVKYDKNVIDPDDIKGLHELLFAKEFHIA